MYSSENHAIHNRLCKFISEVTSDKKLIQYEILVQKEWANEIHRSSLLSVEEHAQLIELLDKISIDCENDLFEWRDELEDLHTHIEKRITLENEELGKKIHIGRSRNDLIATTLRLFVKKICIDKKTQLFNLINSIVENAERNIEVTIPGLTHLQHGQAVHYSHILLSYSEAFLRDTESLDNVIKIAMDSMPLGAAAMAGTTLPIDTDRIAINLGFEKPCVNSYDSVGDRDFILACLDAFSRISIHLSRMAQDFIYWISTPLHLLVLPKSWTTHSSIMPNKTNPEVAELVRGRAAHIISAQLNGYVLMKAIPTAYSGEMQDMKGILISADETLTECLEVWSFFVRDVIVDSERAAELLNTGHILATEIANELAESVPFRDAYHSVKEMINKADLNGCQIHDVAFSMMGRDFSINRAINMRNNNGGTATANVTKRMNAIKKMCQKNI